MQLSFFFGGGEGYLKYAQYIIYNKIYVTTN